MCSVLVHIIDIKEHLDSYVILTYLIFIIFIDAWKIMKILQNSQKYFTVLGIGSEQPKQKSYFNCKVMVGLMLLGYSLTGNTFYLIYVTESFDKYIECICSIVGIVVISTCFLTMVFGMNTLAVCIDNIERLIGTSMQSLFSKLGY